MTSLEPQRANRNGTKQHLCLSRESEINVVVVGAGAIGAFVGASLARGGSEVTLVARGPHLAALQENGLTIQSRGESFYSQLRATDDLAVVAGADTVFLSVKAHGILPIAEELARRLGKGTNIITAQNGIPWWYFQGHPGPHAGRVVESVDPGGNIARLIGAERVIGCVMYCSAEILSPGVVRHVEGTKFVIGEPSGDMSDRCQTIAKAFVDGGLKSPISPDIRTQIWLKLIGNVALNPVSALTRSTLAEMGKSEDLRGVLRQMMVEAADVANAFGISLPVSIDRRLEGGFAVGDHKTSMLQDLEAGRALELDCLTGAVAELAELVDVPVPTTRMIHACAGMLARHGGRQGGVEPWPKS